MAENQDAAPAQRRGATMFDLWGRGRFASAPPLSRLVLAGVRVAWAAGRAQVRVILATQAFTMLAVVIEVLIARSLLTALVRSSQSHVAVGDLVPKIAGLAGLTAALGIAQAVQAHRQRLLTELCSCYGETRVLGVTGSVELATFDDPAFHDRVARAMMAVRSLPSVVNNLTGMLRAIAGAAGAVVALFAIQPLVALILLLVLVPAVLASRRRGRVFHRFATSITQSDRERRYLADLLSDREAAKEVRAFGLAEFLRARHSRLWGRRMEELRHVAADQLRYAVIADLLASIVVSGTLLLLVGLAVSHDISLSSAGASAAATLLLAQRLSLAGASAGNLSESAFYFEDYLALVSISPPLPRKDDAFASADGVAVSVREVSFAYPGASEPTLQRVSLEIAPGEVVALVGENGSGKTTLAKLLAGLYDPEHGSVLWDGREVGKADPEERGRRVAVIFQDFQRYALPVRENIGLGQPDRMDDWPALSRAAEMAGAAEMITRLPKGWDTMLGPAFIGGIDLSLGQWQRMALARALFRDAPFVILDEPTAALDPQAEHDLFADMRRLLAGRSVLLISHRFSSVCEADRIHVLADGRIIETGSHAELISQGGRYAELFTLQAAPYR